MGVVDALKQGEVGEQAQRALRTARDTVTELGPGTATDRLRDLGRQAHADRYLGQVKALEHQYAKRAKKLQRKLEKRVKKLPVDTPLDRRRRSRTRRRGAMGGGAFVVLTALAGAAAFAVWRLRRRDETGHEYSGRFDPADERTATASAHQGNGGAARQSTG